MLINLNSTFYLSEILLLPAYRGQGIGYKMFKELENRVIHSNLYQYIYFVSIIRSENHPQRPVEYKSADRLWEQNGYQKNGAVCTLKWKEIGEDVESNKDLAVWYKKL